MNARSRLKSSLVGEYRKGTVKPTAILIEKLCICLLERLSGYGRPSLSSKLGGSTASRALSVVWKKGLRFKLQSGWELQNRVSLNHSRINPVSAKIQFLILEPEAQQ